MQRDVRYIMTLLNKIEQENMKIFDFCELYCFYRSKDKDEICDFLLDSSFLVYLQNDYISIKNIRKECIDRLMKNLYMDIKDEMIDINFILYNRKGINKLLFYCSKHPYVKRGPLNRYVINYLNHRVTREKRRNV